MKVFPAWMADLGRIVPLVGADLPLHAPTQAYRDVVARIKADPHALGGLVTTHKLDLCAAAGDLFDELDPYARLCGEVSCISKRGERLLGHAKDPLSAGLSLAEFVPPAHWRQTGGAVLCLGAGGAALAISLHLLTALPPEDRPSRLILTDISAERLRHAKQLHAQIGRSCPVDYVLCAPESTARADALLHDLPPASLVINATGMGKDRPGSPLGAAARFPNAGLIWELNYRGELSFLKQAHTQASEQGLRVEDGWRYFLYGWTKVIEEVLHFQLSPDQFQRWADIAARFR